MKNFKKATIEVIRGLPDTCSIEEIMYELNLTAQVLEGLKDEKEGRTLSTSELLKRVDKWKRR